MLRFIPSFKHTIFHTVYICQTFLQNIPSGVIVLSAIAFTYAIVQFLITQYKIFNFKKILNYKKKIPAFLHDIESKHNLEKQIILIENNKPLAFCMGIFNPKIYISSGLLEIMDKKETEAIILHEKYHLENKDNLWLTGLNFLKNMLFFFPITSDLVNHFEGKEEVYADQKATEVLGKRFVISALKKILLYSDNKLYGFSFSKSEHIEIRIYNLIEKSHRQLPAKGKNIAISLISFFIFFTLAFMPITSTEVHAQGKDAVMMCIGNQSCEYRCQQEQKLFTPLLRSS
jgi:Zn-dependent protease with chaperone function